MHSFIILSAILTVSINNMNNNKVLDSFLFSRNYKTVNKTYNYILNNKNDFTELILNKFHYINRYNKTEVPDRLIYLVAINRDRRFFNQLVKLLNNKEYIERGCIYDCPIILSLALYICFDEYPLPDTMKIKYALSDLKDKIQYIKGLTDDDLKNFPDSSIDAVYLEKCLLRAGPYNTNITDRIDAVDFLHDNITNSKYIKTLYWLAITELIDDSFHYRNYIYISIIKAEYAKKMKK